MKKYRVFWTEQKLINCSVMIEAEDEFDAINKLREERYIDEKFNRINYDTGVVVERSSDEWEELK